jgi:ankyrin repeat protein
MQKETTSLSTELTWKDLAKSALNDNNTRSLRDLINSISPEQIKDPITPDGKTLLHHACEKSNLETIIVILERLGEHVFEVASIPDSNNSRPLHLAAKRRDDSADITKIILIVLTAVKDKMGELAAIQDNSQSTLLHLVAERQSPEVTINILKVLGNDVSKLALIFDNNNSTPLHLVAERQDPTTTLTLLEATGGRASEVVIKSNKDGLTLLHLAARHQTSKVTLWLCERIGKQLSELVNKPHEYKSFLSSLLCLMVKNGHASSLARLVSEEGVIISDYWEDFMRIAPFDEAMNQLLILMRLTENSLDLNKSIDLSLLKKIEFALEFIKKDANNEFQLASLQLLFKRYPNSNLCRLALVLISNWNWELLVETYENNYIPNRLELETLSLDESFAEAINYLFTGYNRVLTINPGLSEQEPTVIDKGTLIAQRKDSHLIIYWSDNGQISSKSLGEEEVTDIITLLPEVDTPSKDARLIEMITSKYGHTLFTKVKNLNELTLKNINIKGEMSSYESFLNALASLKNQLQIFRFNDSQLTDKQIFMLALNLSNFHKLKRCELESNELTFNGLRMLLKVLKNDKHPLLNLKELSLSQNYIDSEEEGIQEFEREIEGNLPPEDAVPLNAIYLQGNALFSSKRNKLLYEILRFLLNKAGKKGITVNAFLNSQFLDLKVSHDKNYLEFKFVDQNNVERLEALELSVKQEDKITKLKKDNKLADYKAVSEYIMTEINRSSVGKKSEWENLKFNKISEEKKKVICKELVDYHKTTVSLKGFFNKHSNFKSERIDRIKSLLSPEIRRLYVTHDKGIVYLLAKNKGDEHAALAYEWLTSYNQRFFRAAHLTTRKNVITISFYDRSVIDRANFFMKDFHIAHFVAERNQIKNLHHAICEEKNKGINGKYKWIISSLTSNRDEVQNCLKWAIDKINEHLELNISVPIYHPSKVVKSLKGEDSDVNISKMRLI